MDIEVGKFYKSRDGMKVKIYAVEKMQHPDLYKNIHGAYFDKDRWNCTSWHFNGKSLGPFKSVLDIVSEWTEPHPAESWEVDKKILVSDDGINWYKHYFAKYEDGRFHAWSYGKTSWSSIDKGVTLWKFAKPAEEE